MTLSLRYFALSCLVFLAFQQVADCVTCYYCLACGTTSSSWTSTSSSTSGDSCFKYVYDYGVSSYINRGVRSSCSPGSDGRGGTNYCCTTDNCNSGVPLSSSLGLAFALVAAVSLFKSVMAN